MKSGHGSLSVRLGEPAIPESLHSLLAETSRTFALAIPLLPPEIRDDVTIAYLLLRIADTIEDSIRIGRIEKIAKLTAFANQLELTAIAPPCDLSFSTRPTDNEPELELLSQFSHVLDAARNRPQAVQRPLLAYVQRSSRGMANFVSRNPSGLVQLQSRDEVRQYCYCVAGLVGELLTEIFVARDERLRPIKSDLHRHARWFGEGLQLVNILKDSDRDDALGRRFVPSPNDRQALYTMAREDLKQAAKYVEILQSMDADSGVIAFTDLPLQLAWRTLECVERSGPGSKVPRSEVMTILEKYRHDPLPTAHESTQHGSSPK